MADNLPERFLNAELWSLWQAVYLLGNCPPRSYEDFWAHDRKGGPVADRYADLKNAVTVGSLPSINATGKFPGVRVLPSAAVAWALSRGMPLPPELSKLAVPVTVVAAPVVQAAPQGKPMEAASASDGLKPAQAAPVKPARTRRDVLAPVIERAQSMCDGDKTDTAKVWAQLEVLADNEVPPLLAATDKGIKYSHKSKNKYFTRDALDKRLHPEKRGAPGKRR